MPMQTSRITARTRTPTTEHLLRYLPAGLHAALPAGLRAALLVLLAASRLLLCVLCVLHANKGAAHESLPRHHTGAAHETQQQQQAATTSTNNANQNNTLCDTTPGQDADKDRRGQHADTNGRRDAREFAAREAAWRAGGGEQGGSSEHEEASATDSASALHR